MTAGSLPALRVLIVEDEMLIALMLQDMLESDGMVVEGIANSFAAGLDLARCADAQLAVLDINLGGEEAYPIADVLAGRGIPFIFSTGYGAANVNAGYDRVPTLMKPFEQRALRSAIRAALELAGGRG